MIRAGPNGLLRSHSVHFPAFSACNIWSNLATIGKYRHLFHMLKPKIKYSCPAPASGLKGHPDLSTMHSDLLESRSILNHKV